MFTSWDEFLCHQLPTTIPGARAGRYVPKRQTPSVRFLHRSFLVGPWHSSAITRCTGGTASAHILNKSHVGFSPVGRIDRTTSKGGGRCLVPLHLSQPQLRFKFGV